MKKLVQKRQEEIKKIYPGLTCFKEGVRQIPVESIPGVGKAYHVLPGILCSTACIECVVYSYKTRLTRSSLKIGKFKLCELL